MSQHYIERCKHGVILSQCRCPGPKVNYTIECNPEFCGADEAPREQPAQDVSDELLRRLIDAAYCSCGDCAAARADAKEIQRARAAGGEG